MKVTIEFDDIETAARVLANFGTHTPTAQEPTPAAPTASAEPVQEPTANSDAVDVHGLTWDDSIHSTPATLNADGSWRMKRGQKEAYEAAIAATRSGTDAEPEQTPAQTAPAQTGMPSMPTAQPAAPAPTTPAAPVDYATMAIRFVKLVESGAINDFNAIYNALGVNYDDLETNQTSISRLWGYMDALENGETHDACVRHAMGS